MAAKTTTQRLLLLRPCRRCAPKTLNFLPQIPASPPPLPSPAPARRPFCSSPVDDAIADLRSRVILLTEKPSIPEEDEMDELRTLVSSFADELLSLPDGAEDDEEIAAILESRDFPSLLVRSPPRFASIELLYLLKSRPLLALKVFDWRRKQAEMGIRIISMEYSKVISLAGRVRNVDLADQLFAEAVASEARATCVFNALMSTYMINGLTKKALTVFETLKRDPSCTPTITSYNILLSIYGRSMLIEQMELVLQRIDNLKLHYNVKTYNNAIAGYITAWMWDKMEDILRLMEERQVKPDTETLLLMLRGYAHSGNLEKMEKTYESLVGTVHCIPPLVRTMICAYFKSSDPERVQKIETLLQYIPGDEYRPWLNVLLIRLYAKECLLDDMEQLISEAFQHRTTVTTTGVMRSIISGYFKCNAVDQLANFIKKAEGAGWRLCRSLYHCKMVMYEQQNRLEEMRGVLNEMATFKFDWTRKTFLIMYKAYSKVGRTREAGSVIGLMWKHGLVYPDDSFAC